MSFAIEVSEGRSYAQIIRAVELALALDRHAGASIHCEFDGAPWRHLLSGAQQLRLRSHDGGARSAMLDTNWSAEQHTVLWLRPGTALPAYPPLGAWLVATADADALSSERADAWQGCVRLRPPTSGATPVPAARSLDMPVAVCQSTFAPVPLASEGCLLIGCGDALADQRMVALLCEASPGPLVMFDPYQHHLATGMSGVSQLIAPCGPTQRAMAYAGCRYVVSAQAACRADDHFVWEAAAMGILPLVHHLDVELPSDATWDGRILARALASARAQARPSPGRHGVADLEAEAMRLIHFIGAAATEKPWGVPLGRAHAVQYCTPADVLQAAPNDERVAWVSCGRGAKWDDVAAAWLGRCEYVTLFLDISENALIMGPLFSCLLNLQRRNPRRLMPHVQGIDATDRLITLLSEHLQAHPRRGLDVVHMGEAMPRVLRARSTLEALHGQRLTSPAAATPTPTPANIPTMLVCMPRPVQPARLPMSQVGSPVASEGIFNGMLQDAAGRYAMRWLKKSDGGSHRGRAYLYPFAPKADPSAEEIDFAQLPAALRAGEVDLLMESGPLLAPLLAARRHWATRPIPVVGLLHSIHSITGNLDTMMQLLGPCSRPYDLFISPTACGKVVYERLLAAASEWLAAQTGRMLQYRGEIAVVPYGIDTGWYQGLHAGSCRQALGLPADRMLLLCLGRYSRREKYDLLPLLLALQRLIDRGQDPVLVIVGNAAGSSYRADIQDIVEELGLSSHVILRSDIPGEHKPAYYAAADVFVSPSDNIQETYGLTVLEAMAAGLPVVASCWDGYRELVIDGETGFLVPTHWGQVPEDLLRLLYVVEGTAGYGHRDLHETVAVDVDALAARLYDLVAQRELRARLGAAGRRRCLAHYDIRLQTRRLTDILLERTRMAQVTPLDPAETDRSPFVDQVGRRFGDYTDRMLDAHTRVQITALGRDLARRKTVVKVAHMGSDSEVQRVNSLMSHLQQGPATVAACGAVGVDNLRVLRCLKFGLIELAS